MTTPRLMICNHIDNGFCHDCVEFAFKRLVHEPIASYEVKLFLGSIHEERKWRFSKHDLIRCVGEFQDAKQRENRPFCPVRIEETVFVSGTEYDETGWICTVIQYPRSYIARKDIWQFMLDLADHLLDKFRQNRICVMDDSTVIMRENTRDNE